MKHVHIETIFNGFFVRHTSGLGDNDQWLFGHAHNHLFAAKILIEEQRIPICRVWPEGVAAQYDKDSEGSREEKNGDIIYCAANTQVERLLRYIHVKLAELMFKETARSIRKHVANAICALERDKSLPNEPGWTGYACDIYRLLDDDQILNAYQCLRAGMTMVDADDGHEGSRLLFIALSTATQIRVNTVLSGSGYLLVNPVIPGRLLQIADYLHMDEDRFWKTRLVVLKALEGH